MRQKTLVAADLVVEGCAHVIHIAVGIREPFGGVTVPGADEIVSNKLFLLVPCMSCLQHANEDDTMILWLLVQRYCE